MGSSAPKEEAKPDPATVATSPGENARKQQELRNRRQGGFYSGFSNVQPSSTPSSSTGGSTQTVG